MVLRGRAGVAGGHGQLHWSNNFDEVQDFEGQIRTLAGGTGLMSDAAFNTGTRSQALGDRKAGASADLDALAAYLGSLGTFDASPSRSANGTLTTLAQEGKTVFNNHGCATCHSAAAFTRSGIGNPANIGTLKPSSGQRLFGALGGIDVPTLRDVWATGPYLHDGSAPTLGTAVRAHSSVVMSDVDLDRVTAYLREIGSDEPAPSTNAGGLLASYFNSVTPGGAAALTRTEVVDTDWGTGSPGVGVNADNFSARWSGKLVVPVTGAYVFQTESDDGVRAWVNGVQIINNWTDHAPTLNNSAAVSLTAGQQVDVVLEYYERGGGAVMRWRWQTPGAAGFAAVPAHYLVPTTVTPPVPPVPPSGGLRGQYFSGVALGGAALLTRTEAVNVDWGTAAPGPGVPADNFSARWTGFVTMPTTGSYMLRTLSDDGVRLWVGGSRRINNWSDHGPTYNTTSSLNFSAGQKVPVTLEYYERGGGAVLRLEWRPPGSSSYVAIPAERLSIN
jgi:mono/diheme cytochrome c family protein